MQFPPTGSEQQSEAKQSKAELDVSPHTFLAPSSSPSLPIYAPLRIIKHLSSTPLSTSMATSGVVKKTQKWITSKNLMVSVSRRHNQKENSSPRMKVRGAREEELMEVFQHFDGDGDGKISPSELKAYFRSIGEYMSLEEAGGVVRVLDGDGDQLLDFDDFMELMGKEKGREEDLRKAFEMFEMEDMSAGSCITPKGLQRTLSRLGEKRSYEECVAMVGAYDVDGNGVIDFHEFHQMMAV